MTDSTVLPTRVLVYGGGRMGAGIAHAFLAAGSSVHVIESDTESARAALERVAGSLRKAADKGALAEDLEVILGRVRVSAGPHPDYGDAQLAIEAVPEDLELKQTVFQRLEQELPGAVLATNTSSLSIDAIADGLQAPERVIGLHFFNPVPSSDLLEVVVGSRTAPELVEQARRWAASLGKTAIVVKDSPGFASSRLGVAIALEAVRMVQEGVASAEDIDTAMTLGYRHPIGPLRTTDIVGLDVRLAIAEHLARELGPRFEPPQLLRDKVAAGELGRKTGRGFYDW
ncbi:3-hydroxyacyl-CoA dehydrogenase family protein [Phycicoccus sp. Soil803]|uniref:3-hydroxyacyl-CoA dehydrogenase family protein n=1 Tax=Phycicoccus sp. Soil803 TaxID=1736415 RepID=UPI00071004FF|nr:3-hydroxyacyl-CoA dehydrogenase family protein [Phycicoccus sp. Soil803]KRF25942.1 3-hydroxybutyryl-CoA dehydrogenase [Phycicoccus sp. Soil803]